MSWRSAWQFVLVVAVWGSTWLVIKLHLGVVNPSWSVAYRFAIGAAGLFAWCRWQRLPVRIPPAGYGFVAVLALAQFVLNFNFVYRAEIYITSGLVAVAYSLLVAMNALLARLFLQRPLNPRLLAGSALGVCGTALMFGHEATAGLGTSALIGVGLSVAAVCSASVANVMQITPLGRNLPPLGMLAWSMLVGALMNMVLAFIVAGPPQWDGRMQYLPALLWLGLIASSLVFAIYYNLIRRIGPAEAAWTSVVIPMVAMGLSTLFEGYRWTWQTVAGAMLVLGGMATALWSARRPQSDQSASG